MTDALKDLEGTVSLHNVCKCAYNVQGSSTNKAVPRFNQIQTFIATTLQEQIEENWHQGSTHEEVQVKSDSKRCWECYAINKGEGDSMRSWECSAINQREGDSKRSWECSAINQGEGDSKRSWECSAINRVEGGLRGMLIHTRGGYYIHSCPHFWCSRVQRSQNWWC